jgi:hypothetical protein
MIIILNVSIFVLFSENVTSLLSNQSFDTLISSIQEKVSSQTNKGHDFGYSDQGNINRSTKKRFSHPELVPFFFVGYGQTADYTGQQSEGYNYGYGYGAGYTTESADASATITSPFSANKGIQSPFQTSSKPVQAVSSPFGASQPPQAVSSPFGASQPPQAVSSPFGASQPPQAVRSPFGAAQPTDTSYTPDSGAWWGSDNSDQIQASYEPEIQTTTTSYQPDAYTPVVTEATDKPAGTRAAWEDDDDDLGFGNSKKKPATTTETDNSKTTDSTQEQKPNQVTKEETKEKAQSEKAGGWGIFSIFGRKEKDPNMDEKKAVKANLGEQSSFYYDEKEKRWVNKLVSN